MTARPTPERVFSLIFTRDGGLEIELGPSFCDDDAAPLVAAVAAFSVTSPPGRSQG